MRSIAAQIGETSCVRARRAHSLVLDYESDAADFDVLAAHLARCGACWLYTAEVSAFTRQLRGIGGVAQANRQNKEGDGSWTSTRSDEQLR